MKDKCATSSPLSVSSHLRKLVSLKVSTDDRRLVPTCIVLFPGISERPTDSEPTKLLCPTLLSSQILQSPGLRSASQDQRSQSVGSGYDYFR